MLENAPPEGIIIDISHLPDWATNILKVSQRANLTVQVGLVTLNMFGKPNTDYSKGQLVNLEELHLAPNTYEMNVFILGELHKYGEFNRNGEKAEYQLRLGTDPIRGYFLKQIFQYLAKEELTKNTKSEWDYFLDGNSVFFQYGFEIASLITEYKWKFFEEDNALRGKKSVLDLANGRAAKASNDKYQTRSKMKSYIDLATKIMNESPQIRYGNVSKLAQAIHDHIDCPRKRNEPSSFNNPKLTKKAIQNSLYTLKKQGKLTFSD